MYITQQIASCRCVSAAFFRHILFCRILPKVSNKCIISSIISFALFFCMTATVVGAPFESLKKVGVPDVNSMGLLDQKNGIDSRWPRITKNGKRIELQRLGKALFYDMQVGGDGIQACASCHYHAGADHRKTGQINPGLNSGDVGYDLINAKANGTLNEWHFKYAGDGIPVSEAVLMASGSSPDLPDGRPGKIGNNQLPFDVNDVVSSQGIRRGTHYSVTPNGMAVDIASLESTDPGFNFRYMSPEPGIPDTVRRVPSRNTPSVLNAIYNFRNFWDGRADPFFNGVSPLGFRDPDALVKIYKNGEVGHERLRIPFSSLASQAVGPIGSDMEMVFHDDSSGGGRSHRELGKKMTRVKPLAGQLVDCSDSLLGVLTDCDTIGENRGLVNGYKLMVKDVFDQRFWGDEYGNDVCLDSMGNYLGYSFDGCSDYQEAAYTLLEWNFSMFFGLSIQSYLALLTTENTIVDTISGSNVTGFVTNTLQDKYVEVDVTGLSLDVCIERVALNNSRDQEAVALDLCSRHYSKYIHPGAVAGKESAGARYGYGGIEVEAGGVPIPNGSPIGGCMWPTDTSSSSTPCSSNEDAGQAAIMNIKHGLDRFYSGSTACSSCHVGAEFTSASVSSTTGFGVASDNANAKATRGFPRKTRTPALMERMTAYNGLLAVYDTGFYNIGVRPTPEDLSLGGAINGVPLAYSKLLEMLLDDDIHDMDNTILKSVKNELAFLRQPKSIDDLSPAEFALNLSCGFEGVDERILDGSIRSESPFSKRDNDSRDDMDEDARTRDVSTRSEARFLKRDNGSRFNMNEKEEGSRFRSVGRGNRFLALDSSMEKKDNHNRGAFRKSCDTNLDPGERVVMNGAFKTPGLRNVKFTGPYFHNGSKMNLRQVYEMYKRGGHFPNLSYNNLSTEMRDIDISPRDEASIIEMMETGLTDWRVAYEEAPFDHPEICIPHGHDVVTGQTILVGVPAVGSLGSGQILQTFEEQLAGVNDRAHNLLDECTVPGISMHGLSTIDVPPTHHNTRDSL